MRFRNSAFGKSSKTCSLQTKKNRTFSAAIIYSALFKSLRTQNIIIFNTSNLRTPKTIHGLYLGSAYNTIHDIIIRTENILKFGSNHLDNFKYDGTAEKSTMLTYEKNNTCFE